MIKITALRSFQFPPSTGIGTGMPHFDKLSAGSFFLS